MEPVAAVSCIIPGVYEHVSDTNLDEFLTKIGASFIKRRMMTMMHPTTKLAVSGEEITLTVVTLFKTFETTFKLGKQVDLNSPMGIKKVIFTVEDDRLVQTACDPDDIVKIERTFTETSMDVILVHIPSGTRGVRHYKKV